MNSQPKYAPSGIYAWPWADRPGFFDAPDPQVVISPKKSHSVPRASLMQQTGRRKGL